MAKQVTLSNGRHWGTRKEALAHFKNMLASYKTGDRINDRGDHDDLASLLVLYDSVVPAGDPTKIGSGIDFFSKQRNTNKNPDWATDGFHVHRTDGTSIDFSYIDAVNTNPIL